MENIWELDFFEGAGDRIPPEKLVFGFISAFVSRQIRTRAAWERDANTTTAIAKLSLTCWPTQGSRAGPGRGAKLETGFAGIAPSARRRTRTLASTRRHPSRPAEAWAPFQGGARPRWWTRQAASATPSSTRTCRELWSVRCEQKPPIWKNRLELLRAILCVGGWKQVFSPTLLGLLNTSIK